MTQLAFGNNPLADVEKKKSTLLFGDNPIAEDQGPSEPAPEPQDDEVTGNFITSMASGANHGTGGLLRLVTSTSSACVVMAGRQHPPSIA